MTVELVGAREPAAVSLSDSQLIQAARAGDRSAYGKLYERFAPMVHGILLTRVARGVVDDLVQDVFLKAMIELKKLRDDAHFGQWIAAIARNRAVDHHRRAREVPDAHQIAEATPERETSTAKAEARAALAVLSSLPEAYRETLALRLVEGMTGPEISARTGLSHDSVRVNLHRGMTLLRERLRNPPIPGWAQLEKLEREPVDD